MNSDDIGKKVLSLLQKRKDLLNEMLLTTQTADLSQGVDSADEYISMIEKRETLISEVAEINGVLAQPPLDKTFSSCGGKVQDEAQRIVNESKEIVNHIVTLDKNNMKTVELIMVEIKKNLREISAGKTVNQHYAFDKTFSGSNYFDKSK